jgi:putative transposase
VPNMLGLFACLSPSLEPPPLRHLGRVIEAMLALRGRVTLRGLARWSDKGGRDRTLQRVCTTTLPWGPLHWLRMRQHWLAAAEGVVMRGDEGDVPQAGQPTSGFERFWASLSGPAGPGRGVRRFSLLRVQRRTSYPAVTEHGEKPCEAAAHAQPRQTSRGPRGRPTGRQQRTRRQGELSPALRLIPEPLKRLLQQRGEAGKMGYCICDGALGPNDAMHRGRPVGLPLGSKLRANAALAPMRARLRGVDHGANVARSWTLGICRRHTGQPRRLRQGERPTFIRCLSGIQRVLRGSLWECWCTGMCPHTRRLMGCDAVGIGRWALRMGSTLSGCAANGSAR